MHPSVNLARQIAAGSLASDCADRARTRVHPPAARCGCLNERGSQDGQGKMEPMSGVEPLTY